MSELSCTPKQNFYVNPVEKYAQRPIQLKCTFNSKNMKHIQVPGDGRCLFHSVGQFVGHSAKEVLHNLFQFLKAYGSQKLRPDEPETIADWIFMEHDLSVNEQIQKLDNSFWGGFLDLVVLAQIYGRPIHVYTSWSNVPMIIESNCPICPYDAITIYQNGFSHQNVVLV